ncbi:Nodulation-signaling pathway 2 protein [Camellia lanceoleosa]|uniref:Nodulation-signaling pathway 2 protein n=1 Tax=Camellia lanceoleosa TaxID=1840588 RepID=A0ACC0HP70_9ERIC|nr:Nodulation-signaling pathway 2 protein [Camellia lanceoleosa]
MMQSELFQLSWPSFTNLNSSFNEDKAYILDNMDAHMGHSDFSIFSDEFIDFPVHVDELDFMLPKDDFHQILRNLRTCFRVVRLEKWLHLWRAKKLLFNYHLVEKINGAFSSSGSSLWRRMEKDQIELVEVIMKSIGEKVSPVGEIVERLLYYLFQPSDKQSDYLKQESSKNFHAAFKAFYQIFPYGKFAHFAANLAILEAIPPDVEIIHIVDFDIGEGTQWSSVIEAIGCQQREIRLTSIKWTKGDSNHDHTSGWRFDETKRRLLDHASYFGLNLKVEEMELHNLESEKKKMKKRGGRREWRAFNCMVELPHMGRVRSRRQVMEFLKVAKDVLSIQTPYCNSSTKGIITFGDADGWEILKSL